MGIGVKLSTIRKFVSHFEGIKGNYALKFTKPPGHKGMKHTGVMDKFTSMDKLVEKLQKIRENYPTFPIRGELEDLELSIPNFRLNEGRFIDHRLSLTIEAAHTVTSGKFPYMFAMEITGKIDVDKFFKFF